MRPGLLRRISRSCRSCWVETIRPAAPSASCADFFYLYLRGRPGTSVAIRRVWLSRRFDPVCWIVPCRRDGLWKCRSTLRTLRGKGWPGLGLSVRPADLCIMRMRMARDAQRLSFDHQKRAWQIATEAAGCLVVCCCGLEGRRRRGSMGPVDISLKCYSPIRNRK